MQIGFFDSGIGGLTVLHQAKRAMPQEDYLYYADTDHVPYGRKSLMATLVAVLHATTNAFTPCSAMKSTASCTYCLISPFVLRP